MATETHTNQNVTKRQDEIDRERAELRNEDPITGAPGSHPVGVGVGAAAAGAAGAAIGSVVPGVGTVIGGAVGAVVGAVAGGLAGKGVAEAIFPTEEDVYWRSAYRDRPYYDAESEFDYDRDYSAAYRFGYETAYEFSGSRFEDVEPTLAARWNEIRSDSRLSWLEARHAVADAWERARGRVPASKRVP